MINVIDSHLGDLHFHSRSQACEKAKSSASVFSQCLIDLDEIWYTVDNCWFDEPVIHVISCD